MNRQTNPYPKAQAMLEYLLVMVVVVVIVFLAFGKGGGGPIDQTRAKTKEYFDTGSTAIMGGYYDGTTFVKVEPNAVNGGWCGWTTCINHVRTRECACPRPSFGGTACSGDAADAC